ncbi:MAG: DUF2513 domain-containing protein [Sulfuriferula sp.]
MRINQDYLKSILDAFLSTTEPSITFKDFQRMGLVEDENMFAFHMQILDDKYLIAQMDGGRGFGLRISLDGSYHWAALPLRLTAAGHEFAQALDNKEVWNTIKSNFKEASMDGLLTISKQLLEGFLQKKIDNLLK